MLQMKNFLSFGGGKKKVWSAAVFVLAVFGSLVFADVSKAAFTISSDNVATPAGAIADAGGVAVDNSGGANNGKVYAADVAAGTVKRFNANGTLDGSFAVTLPGARAVVVDSIGNVYVTSGVDIAGSAGQAYAAAYCTAPYEHFDDSSNSLGVYADCYPEVPYIAPVAAVHTASVKKYNQAGTLLQTFGSFGTTGSDKLNKPYGVAVDSAGNVWVADFGNNAIKKFNGTTGAGIAVTGFSVSAPLGIAIDASNNVYVSNYTGNNLQKYNAAGTVLATIGAYGVIDGSFSNPYYVSVSPDGSRVFVADYINQRVQMFSSTASSFTFVTKLTGIPHPTGVAYDNTSGKLWATDRSATQYVRRYLVAESLSITASAGANGTISPTGSVSVASGAVQIFALTPNTGYHADTVTGTCGGTLVGNTFTANAMSASCTVIANFAPAPPVTITSTAGSGGTITKDLADPILQAQSPKYTITATGSNVITGLFVDGVSVPLSAVDDATHTVVKTSASLMTYTFKNVQVNHTIEANFDVAHMASGTFVSTPMNFKNPDNSVINSPNYGKIDWTASTPTGTSIKMRVRTGISANSEDVYTRYSLEWGHPWTSPAELCWYDGDGDCQNYDINWPGYLVTSAVGWSAWSDACNVSNGASVLTSSCVNDGEQYVQYQAILSTDAGTNVPTLGAVTISTKVGYEKNSFLNLISSPFNTTKPFNSVAKISWGSSGADSTVPTQGEIKFQIRTAPDNGSGAPDWTNAKWCGPIACSATLNSTTDFADDYYTDPDGDGTPEQEINPEQKNNGVNPVYDDQWIQYATFLKSNDGTATPTLSSVTMQYAYNVAPEITIDTNSENLKQFADGTFQIPYTLSETYDDMGKIMHGTAAAAIKTALFYRSDAGISVPALTDIYTGDITFNNTSNKPLPKQGTMLVDSELISFDDNAGALTGNYQRRIVERHLDLASSYPTKTANHNNNTAAFFLAPNALQQVGGTCDVTQDCTPLLEDGVATQKATTATKTFVWNPRMDTNSNLDTNNLSGLEIKVIGHDADSLGFNTIGEGIATAQTLDLQAPTISAITTDEPHTATGENKKYYNKDAAQIPLAVNFSENINFDATGGKTMVLHLNSGTCTISSSIVDAQTATCQYAVGAEEKTPEGEYLKLATPFVSTDGIITDNFTNTLTNFSPIANLDQATNIIIDNTRSSANITSLEAGDFIKQDATLTYELDEDLQAGAKIQATDGTNIFEMNLSDLTTGSHSQAASGLSGLVDGVYTFSITGKDLAGNDVADNSIANITFDTTAPSIEITLPADATDGGLTYFNGNETKLGITSDEILRDNIGQTEDAEKNYLKFTNKNNSSDVKMCYFSGAALSTSPREIDFATDCSSDPQLASDTNYKVDFHAVDRAGNTKNADQKTEVVYDTTLPALQYFFSTNANSTAVNPTAAGDVEIVAVYGEKITAGSHLTVKVGPMTANATANLNQLYVNPNNADDPLNNKALKGSFTIGAARTGFDTTPDELKVSNIVDGSESVGDIAKNNQTATERIIADSNNLSNHGSSIVIDTTPAILNSFTIEDNNSKTSFKKDDTFTLVANYNKTIKNGGIVKVLLNTGVGAHEVTLTNPSASKKLTYNYTVLADENSDSVNDLKVAEITEQLVLDGKDAKLEAIGKIENGEYATNALDPVENLAGFRADTNIPQVDANSVLINAGNPETKASTVSVALAVNDNPLTASSSNMSVQFSGDNVVWCDALGNLNQETTFAQTINDISIINTTCGFVAPNPDETMETVYARFIDSAGNISETTNNVAKDLINYDGNAPIIQQVSTTQADGIYGVGQTIQIAAEYNEEVDNASTVTLNFNSLGSVNLIKDTNETNILVGTYTVGAAQDTPQTEKLKVIEIQDEKVIDVAGNNTRDNDSVTPASIIPNNKNIAPSQLVIDTTAPTGTVKINRSPQNVGDNIELIFEPQDARGVDRTGMVAHYEILDDNSTCPLTLTKTKTVNDYSITSDDLDDKTKNLRKICLEYEDSAHNLSFLIQSTTPEIPKNLVYTDISNSAIDFYGAFLTWELPVAPSEIREYQVLDCLANGSNSCTGALNFTINNNTDKNYATFPSRQKDQNYCYWVRFVDHENNISALSDKWCNVAGQAAATPDAKVDFKNGEGDISIRNITKNSAIVAFNTVNGTATTVTPLPTTATVKVYKKYVQTRINPDTELEETVPEAERLQELLGTFSDATSNTAAYKPDHEIILSGLESSTQYYIQIVAVAGLPEVTDPNKINTISYTTTVNSNLNFETLGALTSITEISDPPAVLSDKKVVIEFKTNQMAQCVIDFGSESKKTYDDLHKDDETPAPAFKYNEVSVPEFDYLKNHSMLVPDLFAKTVYYYTITCNGQDGATTVSSAEKKFMTLDQQMTEADFAGRVDVTGPEISSVALASVTGESATITWNTNEKASTLVTYEIEGAGYSMMTGDNVTNSSKERYSTSHSLVLNNLIPATKYLFNVISGDLATNITVSGQSTFTTKQPSSLSSVKVVSTALGQATVTWTTGAAITSSVEYGLTTAYGQSKADNSKSKEHSIILADLKPGETYHFRVKGEDDNGNVFASSDATFQPKSPPVISNFKIDSIFEHGGVVTYTTNVPTDSLVTYTDIKNAENSGFQGKPEIATKHEIKLKDLASGTEFSIKVKVRDEDGNETEETFSNFTTTKDEQSPKVDRVKTDTALTQNDKVQAIISWTTDELATGKIVYKEGKSGEERTFQVNDSPTYSHIGVITSFKPGVVYYFRVKSSDSVGNEGSSTDFAVLTPKKRQNIIQIIIGNFTEIFGWAKF